MIREIDPNTGKPYVLCTSCGQPTLPNGVAKLPNEYDHAQGCELATKTAQTVDLLNSLGAALDLTRKNRKARKSKGGRG